MGQKYSNTISTNAVQWGMNALEKYSPSAFDEINKDQARKHQLLTVARAIAEEEVAIANEFAADPKGGNIRKRLGKYLPENRLKLIEEGFNQQTYQIHITKKMDVYYADFFRDGKAIFSQKKLNTLNAIALTSYIQMASIIVEAVLLILHAVGIQLAVGEQVITRTAEEIIPVIEVSRPLQRAIEALREAAEGGPGWDTATAIFNLIKEVFSAGILWQIIKSLCTNMSWFDWVKTSIIVTVNIIAALATDGVGLIAKIVLALNTAYEFINKLTNLTQLEAIQKEVCGTTPNWQSRNKSKL